MTTTASDTRQRLIEAALEIIRTHGILGWTLDSVAKQAGVSKGGLLHHFPSKDTFIENILLHLFEQFTEQAYRHYQADPREPGRWLRAYVRTQFEVDKPSMELVLMLLPLINPSDFMELVGYDLQSWEARLASDGIRPSRARVVRMAADAYIHDQVLNVAPRSETDRQALLDELLLLIDEAAEDAAGQR